MRELQQIRDSYRQKDADLQSQYQAGDISEDFYRQALAQNAQYLSERLKEQEAFMPGRMNNVRTGRKDCRRGQQLGGQRIRLRFTGSTACDRRYLRDGK